MRRPSVIFALAALTLFAAPAGGLAAGGEEIVFTSDRAENLFGEIYAARVNGAGFRDITRNPAADTNPALSPDGSKLAFWSNRSGVSSVYLSRPDGTGLRRVRGDLDTGGQAPGPLSWSPDGTLLLAAVPRPHGGGGVRNEVDVIDSRRATARRLVPDGCFTPEWSRDGQLVACSQAGEVVVLDLQGHRRFRCAGGEPMWSSNGLLAVSNGGTFIYDSHGQRLARFSGQPRAWAPDGSLLAIERSGSLIVVRPDGTGAVTLVRRLVPGSSRLVPDYVAFTPDGNSVAYDATGAGPRLVTVTGGPSVTLPGYGAWSADSARYAFILPRHGGAQIRIGNRFGGSSILLALLPAGSEVEHLLWSQSDRSIIYDTSHPNNDHELYSIESDGSGLQALTDDPLDELDPAWSPDGSMLVYTSAPYAGLECKGCALTLRIARADGTHSTALTRHGSGIYDSGAAWSPDGTKIAFVRATSDAPGRLYTVRPDGSELAPLAPGMRATAPAWSPDGTTLAFVSSAPSSGGILATDAAGGAVRTEVPTPAGEQASDLHDPEWSPDGTMIAFTGRHGLYLAALGATARRIVTALGAGHPSWSPDGSELAFDALCTSCTTSAGLTLDRNIYTVGVDGSGLLQLTDDPADDSSPAWRPVLG
jgi:Tol biopolymer transport system component